MSREGLRPRLLVGHRSLAARLRERLVEAVIVTRCGCAMSGDSLTVHERDDAKKKAAPKSGQFQWSVCADHPVRRWRAPRNRSAGEAYPNRLTITTLTRATQSGCVSGGDTLMKVTSARRMSPLTVTQHDREGREVGANALSSRTASRNRGRERYLQEAGLQGLLAPTHAYLPRERPSMPETSDSPNRKPLWDALERVMGYRPLLRRECTLWGKITRDWAADGITPDQVERAAKGYRKLYPTLAFTVTALDRHFSASLAEVSKQGAARRDYHSSTGQVSETLVPPPPGFAESLRQTRKAMP